MGGIGPERFFRYILYLGGFPFAAGLMVKVHRHPIGFLPGGHGT